MKITYDLSTLEPYINWLYFYHAWQLTDADKQRQLHGEAEKALDKIGNHYHAHAIFLIANACSDGDDILVNTGDGNIERLPMLRQQQADSDHLCMADFIFPAGKPLPSPLPPTAQIGLFATTVDMGMETDFDADPYQKMMMQLLADRLAEAAAEKLHQEVRTHYWGYAPDEQLSPHELHAEHYQGIRPAVGYPSLPDTSLNFLLDRLLHFSTIGIRLTESGAMKPHASVSGLMMAHKHASYFPIGKIGTDQLTDYAHRRGLPLQLMRRFLASNL